MGKLTRGAVPIDSLHMGDSALVLLEVTVSVARTVKSISQGELAHRCGVDRLYLGAIGQREQNFVRATSWPSRWVAISGKVQGELPSE